MAGATDKVKHTIVIPYQGRREQAIQAVDGLLDEIAKHFLAAFITPVAKRWDGNTCYWKYTIQRTAYARTRHRCGGYTVVDDQKVTVNYTTYPKILEVRWRGTESTVRDYFQRLFERTAEQS